MSKVTIYEIVKQLHECAKEIPPHKKHTFLADALALRIIMHGIAPPFEHKLVEARMGVLLEFLENVCAVSTDKRVARIANKLLDTAKTNGIAPPEGMCIVPIEPTKAQSQEAINTYEELTGDRLRYGDGFNFKIVNQMFQAMLEAYIKETK